MHRDCPRSQEAPSSEKPKSGKNCHVEFESAKFCDGPPLILPGETKFGSDDRRRRPRASPVDLTRSALAGDVLENSAVIEAACAHAEAVTPKNPAAPSNIDLCSEREKQK